MDIRNDSVSTRALQYDDAVLEAGGLPPVEPIAFGANTHTASHQAAADAADAEAFLSAYYCYQE